LPSWNVRRSLWRSSRPTSEERRAALRTRCGHEILEALLATPEAFPTPVAVPATVDGERLAVDEGALLGTTRNATARAASSGVASCIAPVLTGQNHRGKAHPGVRGRVSCGAPAQKLHSAPVDNLIRREKPRNLEPWVSPREDTAYVLGASPVLVPWVASATGLRLDSSGIHRWMR
jgi:hypothetical protein